MKVFVFPGLDSKGWDEVPDPELLADTELWRCGDDHS